MSEPKEIAEQGLHEVVTSLASQWPRGTALDAGAGEGSLSQRLCALGFSVIALDKDTSQFRLPRVPIVSGDLDEGLPFCDNAFDCAFSLEVIEHLENPFLMIREMARVLRPGGHLVLSTPNILRLRSRLLYFFRGFHSNFSPLVMGISSDLAGTPPCALHPFGYHINPVSLIEIILMLERAGLALHDVHTIRLPRLALVGALKPLLRAGYAIGRRLSEWQRISPQLLRWLLRDEVLAGKTLIVHAVKQG